MQRLHKRMIVKLLACGMEPQAIADRLKERCLLDLSADEVARFRPDGNAALPADLTALFHATRAEHRMDEHQAAAAETAFVKVATTASFDGQAALCVEKNDTVIALFKTSDGYYAINNTCTHRDGRLCEGTLDDHEVECPLHGARFDVTTGEATAMPAPDDVDSYDVRVQGEDIEVKLRV